MMLYLCHKKVDYHVYKCGDFTLSRIPPFLMLPPLEATVVNAWANFLMNYQRIFYMVYPVHMAGN